MRTQPDAKWLREMARKVAEEPVPEVDWEKIEQGVFDTLEQPGQPIRLEARPPVWPRVAAVAAVAAGLALVVSWSASRSTELVPPDLAPAEPVAKVQGTTPSRVDDMVGSVLVTEDEPMTVEHEGWARFQLAPDSRVKVQRLDERVALDLIQGKVEAEVNRHANHEIFTVDVDGMRVAVRGTIFSVERHGDSMRVDVERGAVSVGPSGSGAGESWLMESPLTGTYSLAGKAQLSVGPLDTSAEPNSKVGLPEPAKSWQRPPSSAAVKADAANVEEEPLPEMLTNQSASSVLAAIASQVEACHREAIPVSQDGVTVRVRTTITIRVAPDGHVVFARFDPPLVPKAQSCASGVVQQATFPAARKESVLQLPLHL